MRMYAQPSAVERTLLKHSLQVNVFKTVTGSTTGQLEQRAALRARRRQTDLLASGLAKTIFDLAAI